MDGFAGDEDCDDLINPGGKYVLVRLSSSYVPISLHIGKSQKWPDRQLVL